jgi:hypothetical protein
MAFYGGKNQSGCHSFFFFFKFSGLLWDMKRSFVVISIRKFVIVLVCKKITLFRLDFSNETRFRGEFSQIFLSKRGVLEVTPGQKGWRKG